MASMVTASEVTEQASAERRKRKTRVGVVASDKGEQTLKVVCDYSVKHRKYGKYMRRRTIIHVHDAKSEAEVGDRVEVTECRPISKTKHWRLVRVVTRA